MCMCIRCHSLVNKSQARRNQATQKIPLLPWVINQSRVLDGNSHGGEGMGCDILYQFTMQTLYRTEQPQHDLYTLHMREHFRESE